MGWSGFACKACHSIVLVGVAPSGWSSIAIPTCPAVNTDHFTCQGTLVEIPASVLNTMLEPLATVGIIDDKDDLQDGK